MSQASFGKYRLLAELGHGGMADVFLAVSTGPEGLGFSKLVVVKRLRPGLADDPEFIAMLVDEARIAARLNHPNVVQTYEIGQVGKQYFIAMEYLDGQPLNRIATRAKNAKQPLPLNYQVHILADICTGLHHAHELLDYDGQCLGIVHRDVTPHNIFVTYDGQTKLVDFGIAKAAGRASETKQGVVKGKVVYMAPEQATAQNIDRRADIFAVGVMLWEAVTGVRMWKGFDELGIMARLITRDMPGPPSSVKPDADPVLDEICKKALAAKPADRYENAEQMATDLHRWLDKNGGRPTAKEVGSFVGGLFADRRRETRDVIESQLSDLKNAVSNFKIRELPVSTDSGVTPHSGQHKTAPMPAGSGNADEDATISKPTEIPAEHAADAADGESTALVDSGPKKQAAATMPVPSGEIRARVPPPGAVTTLPEAGRLLPPELAPSQAPRKSRLVVGIAAAAVVIASASAYAWVNARGGTARAETTGATTTAAPSASTSATADATIKVFLSSDVEDTTFRIDNGPPLSSPHSAHLKKDDGAHVIIATAPGHDQARFEVAFDHDVTWKPALKPKDDKGAAAAAANKKTPAGGAVRTTPTTEPAPHTSATAAPTATGLSIGPHTEPPPRAKRSLDEDNPYDKKK